MGCYPPLGKMMSRALGKCKGKERRSCSNHRMVYSPPRTYYHHTRVVKSVNFSNDNPIIVIPPEAPAAEPAIPKHHHHHHPQPGSPPGRPEPAPAEPKRPARVRFSDRKDPPQDEHRAGPARPEPAPVFSTPAHRYVPSPLPRWEVDGGRRREYFSGEYCYYPTPLREGIYSIATDPNRLTTIFSEENPNACTIV